MEKPELNDEITVRVEKLVNKGFGLAKIDDFPIFIDNVCPGDEVKAKITNSNKSYANAELISIETPSSYRVKPFCALHNVCGGCQWQFIEYEKQLEEKTNIVKETVQKISGIETDVRPVTRSPQILNYRHKIQLPVQQTKNSKRFLIGYYKKNSHEIINIKHCPIQPEYVEEIVEYIRRRAQELDITAYNERKHKGELRHVAFRLSSSQKNGLVIFVINAKKASDGLKKLARELYDNYEKILGVCVNYNTKQGNVIMSDETACLAGKDYYEENLDGKTYKISSNSFFQINPDSAVNIFNVVKEMIGSRTENPTILDAYSGVSSFGVWLKDIAGEIYCVEDSKSAAKDAKDNAVLNNADNMQVFNGDVKEIFKQFIQEEKTFDVIILDPPRKGCSQNVLDDIIKMSKRFIVYVSCNPATLARDLKYLCDNGFKVHYIQPADMFCHTYHVESVVLLEKI